jgi:hypothetical protein
MLRKTTPTKTKYKDLFPSNRSDNVALSKDYIILHLLDEILDKIGKKGNNLLQLQKLPLKIPYGIMSLLYFGNSIQYLQKKTNTITIRF